MANVDYDDQWRELTQWAEQERRRREQENDYLRRRQDAEKTAAKLLHSLLDETQRADLRRWGHFFVVKTKRFRYRLRIGRVANVDAISDEGKYLYTMCAHVEDPIPNYDNVASQKLMLETDEAQFLRVAYRYGVMRELQGHKMLPARPNAKWYEAWGL